MRRPRKAEWSKLNRSPYAFDYFLLGISLWWMVVLLFPYGTFSYGKRGPSGDWGIVSRVAAPSTWGALLSVSLVLLFVSVVFKYKNIYRIAMFSQSAWWLLVSFMIVSTEPLSTSALVYLLIGIMSFYHFLTAHYITPRAMQSSEEKDFGRNMHTPLD
jgi:magnesium-transporting ATPase (P-type)